MAAKLLLPFLLLVSSVICVQDVPCVTPQDLPGTCVPQGQYKPFEEILITFLNFLFEVNKILARDVPCVTPQDLPGTCVPQGRCKPLEEILKRSSYSSTIDKSEFIANWRCSRRTNRVCCPRENTNQQGVLSAEQHKNYKLLPSLNVCGITSDDRLWLGNETEPLEFPWMALIEMEKKFGEVETRRKRRNFICGGTVINSRYILTAAHCITKLPKNATVISVRLGEHDLSTDKDCSSPEICPPVKDIAIEKIIPHPEFNGYVGTWYDTRNDIGLIRLAQAVDFDDDAEVIAPICLPVTQDMQEKNLEKLQLIVAGWGRTNTAENKERTTDRLLKIHTSVAANNICENKYRSFTVGQICAGGQESAGTCIGDSGGPLMYHGSIPRPKQIKFVQYGVVSAGLVKCGQSEGKPTVFTSVAHHLNWILDQLEP